MGGATASAGPLMGRRGLCLPRRLARADLFFRFFLPLTGCSYWCGSGGELTHPPHLDGPTTDFPGRSFFGRFVADSAANYFGCACAENIDIAGNSLGKSGYCAG